MSNRPNILWLMTDEQRRDSLGCYGSEWAHTPNLDRLAEEGVLFEHAVTPAPVCEPARVSLLTGKYPCETGIWWNDHDHGKKLNFLTTIFEENGYKTATFGKQHYCSPNKAFATEEQLVISDAVHPFYYADEYDEQDFNVIKYPGDPYPWIFGGVFPEEKENTTEVKAVNHAINWLENEAQEQPFLLRVSFNGPHTPVVPPDPFTDLISPDEIKIPPETDSERSNPPQWIAETLASFADSSLLSREDIEKMRSYYYGEVAFLDQQFGVLIDYLEDNGLLEDTIIVFVSDHGAHLGDYDLVQKQTFYEPVVNVPFFFRYPERITKGKKIKTPVETRLMLPTLLELAGIVEQEELGESLYSCLVEGEEPDVKPVFSEFTLGSFEVRHDDRLVMVRDGKWKLSLCLDPEPQDGELYNLEEDPYERTNLFYVETYQNEVDRLSQLIREHIDE